MSTLADLQQQRARVLARLDDAKRAAIQAEGDIVAARADEVLARTKLDRANAALEGHRLALGNVLRAIEWEERQ